MKKAVILILAALMIPSVALAAKPSHSSKTPPQATYELKGTLSNYTAYNAGTSTNGSITIVVSDANPQGKSLKGQTLTFQVDAQTAISLKDGLTTITNGDTGMVKVRAAKNIAPAALAATLQLSPASQINDQGVKKVPQVTYVLKGTLSNYTPYNSVGPVNGSITIVVKSAKPHAKSLKGATLVFTIDANTKVELNDKLTTITDGDKGVIKVRAPKKIAPADLATTLQSYPAKSVHDQGAPKPKH
jgi:glycine cleavage system regulatory protein